MSDCQSNSCFAYAASTQNCNQALFRPEPPLDLTDNIIATNHAAQCGRQVGQSRGFVALAVRGKARDRCDKAISLALHIRDVFVTELAVSQRLAQRRQMDAQAAFLDRYVRPCLRDQFGLGNNSAGLFEKSDQDVVSPAAKRNDLVRLPEAVLGDIQLEWAKPKPDRTRCANLLNRHELFPPRSSTIRFLRRSSSVSCKYTPSYRFIADTSSRNKLSVYRSGGTVGAV